MICSYTFIKLIVCKLLKMFNFSFNFFRLITYITIVIGIHLYKIGRNNKECDIYINRSIIHEMYLQLVQKSTLSPFDGKRGYINESERVP